RHVSRQEAANQDHYFFQDAHCYLEQKKQKVWSIFNFFKSSLEFTNTETLVKEYIETGSPQLKWIASIPCLSGWTKSDLDVVSCSNEYTNWLDVADKETVSLVLKMINPSEKGRPISLPSVQGVLKLPEQRLH
ncbi:hypothetical protein VP01_5697g1, partial [Puccinia sorghi]